ncbi:MAG: tRNA pseudouridine(55) synthase TruB [Melioribacteraceae bacterium]|nr:tRNA pseudouridine(55) synthase TruB [Melioribacteraceae bacterium]
MILRTKTDFSDIDFNKGEVVLIDKEKGFTSFDIVHRIRRFSRVKKVGHAGTLDPRATGLLIICTGKKTKEITEYQNLEKTYEGIFTIGNTTPSFDAETEFDSDNLEAAAKITLEEIEEAKKEFQGAINQVPPMYSALKLNGKALYKYARKGVTVERAPRPVEIYSFDILKYEFPDIYFEIKCSKGTYIRVIANDLGAKLGCGAYLKSLRRTKIGTYNVSDAFEVEELKKLLIPNPVN